MKKIIIFICFASVLAACKHKFNDPLQSDDLSALWGDQPADLDIKLMGYNMYLDGRLTYGILDAINYGDKAKSKSLMRDGKLYINNSLINAPQNSLSLNPFLDSIFKLGKCTVSCKNIASAGYEDFSKEVELAAPIKQRSVTPKNIYGRKLPVTVKWNTDNVGGGEQLLIQVSFMPLAPQESGERFTWNKITDDDGDFTIPADVYSKVNVGYVNVDIYRGTNTHFKDKNNKVVSISSVFKASTSFYVNP